MITLDVKLPDDLGKYAQDQAGRSGYASVADYVQSLICRDRNRSAAKADLEGKLRQGINSGTDVEIKEASWQKKTAGLTAKHSRGAAA